MNTQLSSTQHFNESSQKWDTPEKLLQSQFYADQIKAQVGHESYNRVLEIGCGTGALGGHFMTKTNAYVGVDSSAGMLQVLKTKFENTTEVSTYLLDLDTETLPENEFDLVISSMAFHHLAKPELTLTRMLHLVNPGCIFAIIDLDKEDGSFHADPTKMGVQHFGFTEADIKNWCQETGLQFISRQIIKKIEKNGKLYPVFLAILKA